MTLYSGNRSRSLMNWHGTTWSLFLLLFLFVLIMPVCAEESTTDKESTEQKSENSSILLWPFSHIIQPAVNVAIYPFAAPVRYALNNGLMDKSVDLVTFGKDRKIIVYPTMNLKPGSQTQLGFTYRHCRFFCPVISTGVCWCRRRVLGKIRYYYPCR